eukprot:4772038-Pyramimonas_sp.AAC.1
MDKDMVATSKKFGPEDTEFFTRDCMLDTLKDELVCVPRQGAVHMDVHNRAAQKGAFIAAAAT